MKTCLYVTAILVVWPLPFAWAADKDAERAALKDLNHLVGVWKGTGLPEGTRSEKEKGLWLEEMSWKWQFKGDSAWLEAAFARGKYFTHGELRYLPDTKKYQMTIQTTAKEQLVFKGSLRERRLILERADAKKMEAQRLVFSFLHANRFLYVYEVKPADASLFTRVYQVGATKKGAAFAAGDGQPECVVTGGLGTIKVMYEGKTYYVCCTGCRTEFKESPAKYVKEFEARKAKEVKSDE